MPAPKPAEPQAPAQPAAAPVAVPAQPAAPAQQPAAPVADPPAEPAAAAQPQQAAQPAAAAAEPLANITEESLLEMDEQQRHDQIQYLIDLGATDANVRALPEYQNLMKTVEKVTAAQATAPAAQPGQQPAQSAAQPAAQPPAAAPATPGQQPAAQPAQDTTFNIQPNGQQTAADTFGLDKAPETVNLTDIAQFNELTKTKYSIEDQSKFFQSVDGWRTEAQKQAGTQDQLDKMTNGVTMLPDPVKAAIGAFGKGEDWNQAYLDAGGRLDYNLDFSKQSKEAIVGHFFAEKVVAMNSKLKSEEGYEQENFNTELNELHTLTKPLYQSQKTTFDSQVANLQTQKAEEDRLFTESASSSVESLKQSFPGFDAAKLQSVSQRLTNGDMSNLFFDRNGNYLPDAAKKLAFALFGDDLLKTRTQQVATEASSAATLAVVEQAATTPTTGGGATDAAQPQQQASDATSHLGGDGSDPYAQEMVAG